MRIVFDSCVNGKSKMLVNNRISKCNYVTFWILFEFHLTPRLCCTVCLHRLYAPVTVMRWQRESYSFETQPSATHSPGGSIGRSTHCSCWCCFCMWWWATWWWCWCWGRWWCEEGALVLPPPSTSAERWLLENKSSSPLYDSIVRGAANI